MRREDVDHAIDTLRCTISVQGGKHQVACLSNGDSSTNRLKIAHLTNQHHVWVLAQARAQRSAKGVGIIVHFALHDHRAFTLVSELDRVFNGDDVVRLLSVDLINQSS